MRFALGFYLLIVASFGYAVASIAREGMRDRRRAGRPQITGAGAALTALALTATILWPLTLPVAWILFRQPRPDGRL